MSNHLKLSIVTINFNDVEGLEKTINSVIGQVFGDYEYIVIDGGSTDGSKEVIEQYQKNIDHWVSEPDRGVYYAMNKGIRKATGEYLLFLNSGDTLGDSSVVKKIFSEKRREDILYGNLIVNNSGNKWVKTYPEILTFGYFCKDTLPHPSTFIKKEIFDKVGYYNEENRIVSDWEFFILAIAKHNCSYKHFPFPVSVFQLDGISSKPENQGLILKEKEKVLLGHFAAFLADYEELKKYRNLFNARSQRFGWSKMKKYFLRRI